MPTLVIDTREKDPFDFPGIDDTKRATLTVGDYTHEGFEHTYAVERKSLDDLARSVGTDRTRFENEIRRAHGQAHRNEDGNPIPGTKPDHGGLSEFAVVVESSRRDVENYAKQLDAEGLSVREAKFEALDGKRHVPYLSEMHPNALLGTVGSWSSKYPLLTFHWCNTKEDAKQIALRLLDKWYLDYGSKWE